MRSGNKTLSIVVAVLAAACTKSSPSDSTDPSGPTSGGSPSAAAAAAGIEKIDHIVIIVQENRSFDHYFGTYPGADGIPMKNGKPKDCVPDPQLNKCDYPFHSKLLYNNGGPHGQPHSIADINNGKMDGFIRSAILGGDNFCLIYRTLGKCANSLGPDLQPDVMSYHTRREIPNYWAYADEYVLQDRFFAAVDSWTLPAHLFLTSAWAAVCSEQDDPMSCKSDPEMNPDNAVKFGPDRKPPYAWTDITYLLHKAGVSWKYYVAPGTCLKAPCGNHQLGTPRAMNPVPGFTTVRENGQMGNVQADTSYFRDAEEGTLPSVSWVIPGRGYSEHPSGGEDNLALGMQHVTQVVNAAMKGPDWDSTAIFLTWDEWGGFYDHVPPPKIDGAGYGIRVPGLVISPYAKKGYIDHQTLTTDAYLKFIEDRFLGGQRLDPATDGRPDPRPTVREDVKELGDLIEVFDFTQPPRKPLILDPNPLPKSMMRAPPGP